MRRVIFMVVLTLPIVLFSQAHIGSTLAEIKAKYPDNVFKIDFTNNGQKYAKTEMPLGMFVYYFDNKTGLSNFCIQIPSNITNLNSQVEIYNKKYVIVSKTSWRAYLDGGGIMSIKLNYDEEYKIYSFTYTSSDD